MLKKILLIAACIVIYQNAGALKHFFTDKPHAENQIASTQKVVLYATDWCGYCKKTRHFLENRKISYIEYDIEKSKQGREAYDRLGGGGIPLIEVNGTLVRGYSPDEILAALK